MTTIEKGAAGGFGPPQVSNPKTAAGTLPRVPTVASLDGLASPFLAGELETFLRNLGLEDLTAWAVDVLSGGGIGSQAEFDLKLEEQPAFQQRFPAIFERREAGLPPVSAQDILIYESQVNDLTSFWGIPEGVIDAQNQMILNRSYNELQAVISDVAQFRNEDPAQLDELQRLFGVGVTRGEMIAWALDEEATLPIIQTRLEAARVSNLADRQGFGQLTAQEAELLVQQGLDADQAGQAFAVLANASELFAPLPGSVGENVTREDQLALAAGDATVSRRLAAEAARRLATFDEGGGFAGGTAGIGTAT